MSAIHNRIQQALSSQRQQYRWRDHKARHQGQGRLLINSNGDSLLNFASNDYLGFAQHPKVIEAVTQALSLYGVGSGGSALVTGFHQLHLALCDRLADFTGQEKVLLFGAGFSANQGILTALMTDGDLIVQDKLNHASLIDAGQHSKATSVRFRHNDLTSAQQQLQRQGQGKLLVTESVFSMDGDQAPLPELAEICHQHQALLMVDDAHGLGVIGESGRGAMSIEPQIDLYMATFGKAIGVSGAMVAADTDLIDYLSQFCRHYIYTTAMPPALAAGVSASLDLLEQEPEHVARLQQRIRQFRQLAGQAGIALTSSNSAIQPIILPGSTQVMAVAHQLAQHGIACGAIRAPTVKAGEERLRLTISASHSEQDIEQCVNALEIVLTHEQEQNS